MRNRNPYAYTLVTLVAIMMTACGVDSTAPKTDRSAQEQGTTQPTPDPEDKKDLAEIALSDLAQRLGVDRQVLQVVDSSSVTWPNGALGCPAPDGSYTQALVQGFHLVLTDGIAEYHYHASAAGEPFLCPDKRRGDPIATHQQEF